MITQVGVQALQAGAAVAVCHDRKHREWMNAALRDGFARAQPSVAGVADHVYGEAICPEMSFDLPNSWTELCLSISDWLSWEVGRWIRGEPVSQAFEGCADLMTFLHFDDIGREVRTARLGGEVTEELPDLPRDIRSMCLST